MIKYSITVADNRCELKDDSVVELLTLSMPVDGATITKNYGVWKNETERSWTISIVDINGDLPRHKIYVYARLLRDFFNQQCVMLTVSEIKGELI